MTVIAANPSSPTPIRGARRMPSAGLIADLRARFADRLCTQQAVLLQHGRDESSFAPEPPDAVVYVQNVEEVVFVVQACAQECVPLIGFGSGSSVEGHLLAVEGGVCIDFSRMNRILSISAGDLSATVEAGVTRSQLNLALAQTGLFFSVDPGADATVGGMVATAASGTNSVRYGTMRDNLINLSVVMADGQQLRTASHARKSAAGYNLTQLFCGSEGTLGLITEATVRLHPRSERTAAAVVRFPSVRAAIGCVIESIQFGVPLARAELLDVLTVRAVNAHSHTGLAELPTLFLEFGGSQNHIDEQAAQVGEIAGGHGGDAFCWAHRPEERSRLWTPRHHAYFACLQLRPGCRSMTTDACVPLSRLASCVEETQADIAEHGLTAPILGHVGDGNFHCLVLVDPHRPEEAEAAEAFSRRLIARALRHGGTSTGEHGVGLHKMQYLQAEHGEAGVALMRTIKRALDPHNIFNPGKLAGYR
ncbi:FAD-binding protein [Xylophilus rhododendri]|uniref:D-lactate dehydrogenase (cytochrome) n=1 Tax=Xylophilus rhododendri TaxID=2697032 RepID=A0A857J6I0_9BURK|nr:FAD-linked oxidase C-terminal domain-containing protein [Xylophilus rhododendri]QHI98425.1 FAD-binding protein [Xylophilus rhododendri]